MPSRQNPVILTYHSISVGSSPLDTSPSLFRSQMEWLCRHADGIPLEELVVMLQQGTLPSGRVAVLTFDDGFRDFYFEAAPVLQRLGLPATVFLPTAFCGKSNAWPGQARWVRERPLMDWNEIRELMKQGITFGAHSVNHPALTDLPPADLEREIADSKRDIEMRIGRTPEFFCYPYGLWNADVREVVRRHFRGACSTGAGVVAGGADPYALPRVDAHYVRNAAWFRSMFTSRFRAYLAARRVVRKLRGAPEGYLAAR